MMELALVERFRLDFARSAESRREQERINQFNIAERDKLEKKEKEEREEQQELTELMQTVVLATDIELEAFEAKLDNYDRATVEALMKNAKKLDAAQKKVDKILEQAHELPDGRRVFLTEDGTKVFDEHGIEVGKSVIDPDEIDPRLDRWEVFKDKADERDKLARERQELLDYQEKIDKARDRLDSGKPMTAAELKEIDKDLGDSAPTAVKQQLERRADADNDDMSLSMDDIEQTAERSPNNQRQTGLRFTPV